MGTIYYEMGDMINAKKWLGEADKISKGRCFREEPEKYRKFLMEKWLCDFPLMRRIGHKIMTEQLDDVVYGRISELSELANDLLNANDAISAIELLLGALNLLPNPKNKTSKQMLVQALFINLSS